MLIAAGLLGIIAATMIGWVVARAGFPLPDGARRMGCVDGLRGYLALLVMVYHFVLWSFSARFGHPWQRPESGLLDSLGPGSVNLFFMVTGFVFYPRILAGLKRTEWRGVYISRIFRILPLVVVSLFVIGFTILVRLDFHPRAPWTETSLAALKWLTSWSQPALFGYDESASLNASVLWSLGYEWLFYFLVLPVAAAVMDGIKRIGLPTIVVPILIALVGLAVPKLMSGPGLFNYLPMFACGMLAFEVARSRLSPILAAPWASVPLALLYVAGLLAGHAHGPIRLICHAAFFTGVACGNSLFSLFRSRGALALGEASYAIYLLHGYVLNVLFVDANGLAVAGPPSAMIALLPMVAISVSLIALASFRYIELPMIALGKRVAGRTVGRRTGLDEPTLQVAP